MNYKIELTREELTTILQVATGNVKDFVMDNDKFINEQLEAINYTHSYILGDLKDKTKMEIPKLIEREDEFCESIDCERTEDTRQFIYDSRNDKSVMNLPYVLLEYKQWLIDEGFIKELK